MDEIEVREAGGDDAAAIARVHVLSWQAAYRGLMPEKYLEMLDDCVRADRWRRSIESGQGQVLMALVNDEEVVGFAAFLASRDGDSNPGCGEVSAIYLLPEVWSRGAGRALMDAALVALADAGFTEATLWVLVGNERAIRFYGRCDFEPDGATKTDVSRGFPLQELRYRRDLGIGLSPVPDRR